MARPKRQMHFGVFWVGTGNHLAGWRREGAASSNSYWPDVVESAQIAERGKLDMFFIANSVGMDFTFPPSFLSRHEPTTLFAALATVTSRIGLGGTVSTSFSEPYNVARAFAQHRQHQRRPRRLERGDLLARYRRAEFQPGQHQGPRPALRDCRANSSMSCAAFGIPGTTARSSPTRRPENSSTSPRSASSITKGNTFPSKGRSTSSAVRKAIRSSSRPAARRPVRNCRRGSPMWCSPWSTATPSSPRPTTTRSSSAWPNTAASRTSLPFFQA